MATPKLAPSDVFINLPFEALSNIFPDPPKAPLTDIDDMLWVYRRLRKFRNQLPTNVYAVSPFKRLVLTAVALVAERSMSRRTTDPGA